MGKRKLKVGIIGCGVMGQNHLRVCKNIPDIEVVGVCDINLMVAKKMGTTYNTSYFTNHHDLLSKGLDIAHIAVPTTCHNKIAHDCLDTGVNILIEKPIADTIENAKSIVEKAKEKKLKLMVGHTERFNPAISRLKEIISYGRLGEIASVSTKRVGPYPSRNYDVGIILDLGTHDIDVISYLYNEKVREVYAIAGCQIHCHEDHASLMLRFCNGNAGMIETNWLTPTRQRKLSVIGSKGIAGLDFIEQKLTVFENGTTHEIKVSPSPPLSAEIEHFVKCVKYNTAPLVTGEESIHALVVALAAISSYKSKKAMIITNSSFTHA